MLQLGNFKGWINVDGRELPEYGVEYSKDGEQATCWIPSKVGQNFVICFRIDKCSVATASRIFVDGVKVRGTCFDPSRKPQTIERRGISSSPTTEKLFVFSQLELTDDDDFLAASPGLGEIRLAIAEVVFTGRVCRNRHKVVESLSHKVHERSKKGIVHGISFGDEVRRMPGVRRKTKDVRQLATFVFKYRPLDVLQADGIAPKDTPLASQSSKAGDVEETSVESSGSSSARKRALMEELRQIEELESRKRKSDGAQGGRVKKERRELVQLGDVIDLT